MRQFKKLISADSDRQLTVALAFQTGIRFRAISRLKFGTASLAGARSAFRRLELVA
jgi:hypothetical protein